MTYEVIVGTANPDHKLIPGLTANLTIYTMSENDVLLLPANAFTFEPEDNADAENLPQPADALDKSELTPDERGVWVLEGNSLVNKAVKIGMTNGIKTSILSGLAEGDLVATGYEHESAMGTADGPSDMQSPFAPNRRAKTRKNKELRLR